MAARDHVLLFTLIGVIIINIIAIIILNNRLADQAQQPAVPAPASAEAPAAQPSRPVVRTQPLVRTLLLQNDQVCPDCFDISLYTEALNDTISMQVERVPADAIGQFNLQRLPSIAFNKTLENYPALLQGWENTGTIVNITSGPYQGTWYVLPTYNPPYYSPKENRVHGRVTVTYVTLASCAECYDVYLNKEFLNASRITPYKEVVIDAESAQGRALVRKYNISAVPTVIMDAEAGEYTNLQPGWDVVGSVEADGSYVLRDLQRLQVPYYDLALKKLMKP